MLYLTELQPKLYNQKSFYNKAKIETIDNQINLLSYTTKMATVQDGKIIFLNEDIKNYTSTTLKHLKDFLYQTLGLEGLTKKDILKLKEEV